MKRAILSAICVLLVPALALAAGYTATLTGASGTGVAVITTSGSTISYNILVSGLSSPDSASLSDGAMTVDLAPSFSNGSASGSLTDASAAAAIDADPTAWTVTVGNGTDTLSGPLMGSAGGGEGVVLYHPVIAKVAGLEGTNFVTDVRILNRSGGTATVSIDYYAEGSDHSSPTSTATVTVADGEQMVANDIVGTVLGGTDTKGAAVITSDRMISTAARIYNDQSDAGEGTFGQFQPGLPMSSGWAAGAVIFLSNEDSASGEGYRANLGWFNPNSSSVSVTFTAYDADGTMIGQASGSAAAMESDQVNIGQLFPALATYGDCYITYSTGGGEHLFVYASVVDNVNGDAIYITAVED